MVAKTAVGQRAMIFLEAVRGILEELPEVAEEWDTLPDHERVSWSLGWAHAMADQLGELAEMHQHEGLSPEHVTCYRELLEQLKAALPTIRLLNIYPPPVPLDD